MSSYDPLLSNSASTVVSSPENGLKKFACKWQGCEKSFSRSEHLHRHALNHKDGNNTCLRCAAHFRRRDLLDRHMLRHKEKDEKAGGEGLGQLATRKRLWRDANGNIVNARRPYGQQGPKRHQETSIQQSPEAEFPRQDISFNTKAIIPHIPPEPINNMRYLHDLDYVANTSAQGPWAEIDRNVPLLEEHTDTFDFLFNADWGSQPFEIPMESSSDMPYDDIFKPDSAMSFNAPFTTSSYYNWLFEDDYTKLAATALPQQASQSTFASMGNSNGHTEEESPSNVDRQTLGLHVGEVIESHLRERPQLLFESIETRSTLPNVSQNVNVNLSTQSQDPAPPSSTPDVIEKEAPQMKNSGQLSKQTPSLASERSGNNRLESTQSTISSESYSNPSSATFDKSTALSSYSSSQNQRSSTNLPGSQASTPPNQRSAYMNTQTLPDTYAARTTPKLPSITTQVRDSLIQLISQGHAIKPNGSEISPSDPLLSLPSLQHYSDLFFTRFNCAYPLIHQATFEPSKVHGFLLMSILLLGATYSDKEAHMLAVCLHDIMRPLIHSSKELNTKPELWMLQTILLVECFGKSRAGQKQHEMSHLYHGLLINLIRRSDCQSAHSPLFNPQTNNLDEYWRLSVAAEQKRRLAMLCFMWDTQHAVLFSQSLCMNASELKLTLPWDNAIWEATTSSDWLRLTQNVPAPLQYLSILRMYTNPSSSGVPNHLNALSRVLIFHGLMSISWDLNRRDQTSLSLSITNSSLPWQTRMSSCYASWKADYEKYTMAVLGALSFSPSHRAKFQRFSIANIAVYHTAQLILDIDIIDLQIYAGASHIIGRPVTDIDQTRSKSKIEECVARNKGKAFANATWHAARLLRDGVRKLENWDVDEMFHYPWCLYLAALMCWTLHNAVIRGRNSISPSRPMAYEAGIHESSSHPASSSSLTSAFDEKIETPDQNEDPEDDDSDWDSRVEMIALISGLTKLNPTKENFVSEIWDVGQKHRTQGLLKCMVKHLRTVRWAVVRQGMIVLEGLPR